MHDFSNWFDFFFFFAAPVIHCMTAFLETTDCTRPYELLRFSCLGVISALVQVLFHFYWPQTPSCSIRWQPMYCEVQHP